jgi:hypothetical protein
MGALCDCDSRVPRRGSSQVRLIRGVALASLFSLVAIRNSKQADEKETGLANLSRMERSPNVVAEYHKHFLVATYRGKFEPSESNLNRIICLSHCKHKHYINKIIPLIHEFNTSFSYCSFVLLLTFNLPV